MVEYYKREVFYNKTGLMKYISHLDLYRLFMRALRRADLPYYLTKGFSPRPKISFKRAYKLGEEVSGAEVCFYLKEDIPLEDFLSSMNKNLPEGVRLSCKEE